MTCFQRQLSPLDMWICFFFFTNCSVGFRSCIVCLFFPFTNCLVLDHGIVCLCLPLSSVTRWIAMKNEQHFQYTYQTITQGNVYYKLKKRLFRIYFVMTWIYFFTNRLVLDYGIVVFVFLCHQQHADLLSSLCLRYIRVKFKVS